MSVVFKQVLFDEYGGFADKRLKKIEHDAPFIVDDRSDRDFGADKQLYPWFCSICVRVVGTNMFDLEIRRNVPLSDEVEALFATRGAVVQRANEGHLVELRLTVDDAPFLEQLAKAVETIVAPDNAYGVQSYKYVCPRTAKSLRRLAQLLAAKRSLLATAGVPSASKSGTGYLF